MGHGAVQPAGIGVIEHRQGGLFALRLHVVAGDLSSTDLKKVAEVAERFGRGRVHLTTRQGIEIPFVEKMYLDTARKELEAAGIAMGASGRRVRIIAGCPGNTVCKQGLIDTREIARQLDERYFGQEMPHKFKMSVTGCPNNCAKATENDVGIMGGVEPRWQKSECFNCGACVYICPVAAISVVEEDYVVDKEKCINCGFCVSGCPNAAWTVARRGCTVWMGGTMGRKPRLATKLPGLFTGKEELLDLIDRVIQYYRTKGHERERFGRTLERIGLESALSDLKMDGKS
jgi:dissimilatory sulfite reductase (desulfoviridin) alpha/beta subunit